MLELEGLLRLEPLPLPLPSLETYTHMRVTTGPRGRMGRRPMTPRALAQLGNLFQYLMSTTRPQIHIPIVRNRSSAMISRPPRAEPLSERDS